MQDIHKRNTEIQQKIEDETELDASTQASTTFDNFSDMTIARLTALYDYYKKQTTAQSNSSLRSSSCPSNASSSLKLPKLHVASFSGSHLDEIFYFLSTMFRQNCTEEDKLHAGSQFTKMSILDRYSCFNCLQSGHRQRHHDPSKATRTKRKVKCSRIIQYST